MAAPWVTVASKLFGWLGGSGGGIISQGINLISERTEDTDKRNAAIVELVRIDVEREKNPVWLQALPHWGTLTVGARLALSAMIWAAALHYFSRIVIIGFSLWLYVEHQKALGQPIDVEVMLTFIAPAGLYVLMKGKGK